MNAAPTRTHDADLALAARDPALPCLLYLLDDDLLSELVGEPLHITRVRYKPRNSVLVAFRRTGGVYDGAAYTAIGNLRTGDVGTANAGAATPGTAGYGWALSTKGGDKLDGRARAAARRSPSGGQFSSQPVGGVGRGVRLIRPSLPGSDAAVVAVGAIEDDWLLYKNLRWLAERGLDALGVPNGSTARVLRYKPERRLVLLQEISGGSSPASSIVIKTAAPASDDEAQRLFQRSLEQHAVPVLPRLADARCSRHGVSASPAWGDRDLTAAGDAGAARLAGAALARLHGLPADAAPGPVLTQEAFVARQLDATCRMVAELMPALAGPAAQLAGRLRSRLEEITGGQAPVLIHGDFSADQVRIGGDEVRLIDFDRVRPGAPETDIGSFAAVEEDIAVRDPGGAGPVAGGLKTAQLIDGYRESGGHVSQAGVDNWAAFRLFLDSVDPFRNRASDWPADTNWHIRRASELIA